MAEYIDRDKVLAFQNELEPLFVSSQGTVFSVTRDSNLVAFINDIPAADVVEVRHGRWIADKEDVEWGNYLIHYRCSECKKRPHFDKDKHKFILFPYCPNCGAKMDGE